MNALRNKLVFAAAGAVALALAAGLGLSTWAFRRERQATANEHRILYVADMNLAQSAWDQSNLAQLDKLLEETRTFPDRGFEWYYWQRQNHLCLKTLRGHKYPDWYSLCFSNDYGGAMSAKTLKTFYAESFIRANLARFLIPPRDDTCQFSLEMYPDETFTMDSDYYFSYPWHPAVDSVAFSPDGQHIVTGGGEQVARVWEVASGRELLTLSGHHGEILSVAFSPDGQRIVTGSEDHTAKVWEAASGRELLTIKGHILGILSVAFSPDGQRIITGSQDHTAKVWEAASGRKLLALKGHDAGIMSAVFSPDGQRIVTGSADNTAKVWEAASGRELLTIKGHGDGITFVAFSPDSQRIVTGSRDLTPQVWDVVTGRELLAFKELAGAVRSLAFSPDGRRIVTGCQDKTARVWDALSGRELLALKGHTDQVLSVAFSPDGRRIATGSADGTAKLWAAASDRGPLLLQDDGIKSAAFSPDGKRFFTAGTFDAKVWDAASARELLTLQWLDPTNQRPAPKVFEPFKGAVLSCAAFSPDGQRIVTVSDDGQAKLWDAANGRELLALNLKARSRPGYVVSRYINVVAFSPDSKRLFVGVGNEKSSSFTNGSLGICIGDGAPMLWDTATGAELDRWGPGTLWGIAGGNDSCAISCAAFSPDGQRIVTASKTGCPGNSGYFAELWDATNGHHLSSLGPHTIPSVVSHLLAVAFSPDGQRIVTGYADGTAKLWEAASGRELLTLEGHNDAVLSVAFAPDGRRIVTGSKDKTVKVWDVVSGWELLTFKEFAGEVRSVAFSPDGLRIVTCSGGIGGSGQVKVWEAASQEQVAQWQSEEAGMESHLPRPHLALPVRLANALAVVRYKISPILKMWPEFLCLGLLGLFLWANSRGQSRKKLEQINEPAYSKNAPPKAAGGPWICSRCGEVSGPQCVACWKCGTARKNPSSPANF